MGQFDAGQPRPMLDHVGPVLDDAAQLYVAIRTRSGPHVTPELFTVSDGRILCLTSATTLKAKLVRNDPVASIVARAGTSAVVVVGSVEVLDPLSPATAISSPRLIAAAPVGVWRFVRDNARELTGAAVDLIAGRLGGPLPPRRVIVAVIPTAVALVDGDTLTSASGWGGAALAAPTGEPDEGEEEVDLTDAPDHLASLAVAGPAVVGWLRQDGTPLALPVAWDPDTTTARVPTSLFETCGAEAESPACVTFDTWTGFGPSGKRGLMLRGTGTATVGGATTSLALDVRRATHWDGIETASTDLDTEAAS